MNDHGTPNTLQCEREVQIKTIDSGRHRNSPNPLISILRFMKCSMHEIKTVGYKKEKIMTPLTSLYMLPGDVQEGEKRIKARFKLFNN